MLKTVGLVDATFIRVEEYFFQHSLILLRADVIVTRMKDSRCLLYLPFLVYLTAKPNELNTEFK
jgi:hypothetical protein